MGLKMFAGKSVGDLSVSRPEEQLMVYQRLAFYKYGNDGGMNPGWSVPEIERDFKIPGKRTKWSKMAVDDDLALRYRFWDRTERVNPESE